jgi:SAM-dependent methyltransferase
MDYQRIGNEAKIVLDPTYSARYRESDETEIASENHKRICSILADISGSFGHRISVLDLGCGTGRYFHCLQHVERLIGIDIALTMLKYACDPIKNNEIRINNIDLICGNIFDLHFNDELFDFIYSIGVLGEVAPFDLYLCNKLFSLLKPEGKLFFTVVDVFSKFEFMSLKRRIAERLCPLLPSILKEKLRERLMTFFMTDLELREILGKSKFTQYEILRHVSTSPFWRGAHYECIATKVRALPNNG